MLLFDEDKLKAVAYYRHSAEDKQENSVEIQREQVEKFAEREKVQIVEHFQDEGISGLTAHRPGFQEMFSKWVTNPDAPHIDYILVYDASRFGRFQEMAEVWKWLGLCNQSDIKLATVTRGLPKRETSVIDSFILTLDFSMSGEFSKILSDKVIYGCIKVSEQGFSAGGMAPYGYARILLNEQHERIGILQQGDHKIISNQRVKFEPASDGTADVVKRVFHEFVELDLFPADIAERLNQSGFLTATGKQWNSSGVIRVLTNETYMGTRVYNKTWHRLKQKQHSNPQSEWVRCLDAHEAIIDVDRFQKAQERLYWLRPRSRNTAVCHINAAETYIKRYIEEVIAELSDDQKHYIRRFLPVVFGATYVLNGSERACFYLPSERARYNKVLACKISTAQDIQKPLAGVYYVNTADKNYVVLDEHAEYSALTREELRATIMELVAEVLSSRVPWLITTTAPQSRSSQLQSITSS